MTPAHGRSSADPRAGSSQRTNLQRATVTVHITGEEQVDWVVEFASTTRPEVAGSSASTAELAPAGAGRWRLSGTSPAGGTGAAPAARVAICG